MARYTGPRERINRRFGMALFGPSKALERRSYGPGQHGLRNARKKNSDFSLMLAEKQKLRFQYGIMEKQFRKYYETAANTRGVTGEILLQLLETRLDNVVFRLGLGNTRRAARQFVGHGHILVDGKRVDIPSYQVKPGQNIAVREAAGSQQLGMRLMDQSQARPQVDWLTVDREKLTAKMARLPIREDIDPIVNEQLIVEFYSR
ncbi:MAG: 30S ribosomal protein S4 [Verrucomicrobiota bacterium]